MLSALRELWSRLAGGGSAAGPGDAAETPAIEYKGYRIRATPYRNNGQYQTSGVIEKDTPDGTKTHRFIRADTYANLDDAISFSITKAKQVIDQQGDRIFDDIRRA